MTFGDASGEQSEGGDDRQVEPVRRRLQRERALRGIRDGVAYGGPYHVEIYPADRCNIDCFFCSTAEIRAGNFALSRERLTALFDEMQALGVRPDEAARPGTLLAALLAAL